MSDPTERFVEANGLRHHVLEWLGDGPTVLLAHGFLDMAWSFRDVAKALSARGFRCVAWDWRGHGETEHIGAGGYYHFADYVLDLDELWPSLVPEGEKAHLVGHSMGGSAVTMFAAVRSDRLHTLALLEGLGPPDQPVAKAPEKLQLWLHGVARARAKEGRTFTLKEAVARMRRQNPALSEDLGAFLAEKGTRAVDEGRQWSFDRLHRTPSPSVFQAALFTQYLRAIAVPTLVVGAEKGYRLADEAERLAVIPKGRLVELPGVGHMMHWEAPEALADVLVAHFEP
ncbi:MAG: alpha/beta hydrolase [Deltaproteobacteria bacterium]|nr:alpha/beta hydrolase [Deltaproteobacteria bacterium]